MGVKLPSAGNILTGGLLTNRGQFNPLTGGLEGSGIKMGFGAKPPSAPSLSMPPPAAHPPSLGSSNIALAGLQAKERAAAMEGMGFDNTIKTSPVGTITPANKATATLLGQ